MLLGVSCGRTEGTKKMKKHVMVQLHPYAHLPPPYAVATVFCVCGQTVDVIKHAKFQVNQFRDFEPLGAEIYCPPLTWHIALTVVYALTCYTVITVH